MLKFYINLGYGRNVFLKIALYSYNWHTNVSAKHFLMVELDMF